MRKWFRPAGDPPPAGEAQPASPAAPAGRPGDVAARADRDTTMIIDSESGWAIGTEADLADADDDPVHEVLKKTDVWFAYKAGALEKEARELAAIHAEKGQPRHDLVRDGPLEMEVLLEQHAAEVMWGWMDRVHRKMQGAVSAETEKIGTAVAAAKRAVANAEAAHGELESHPRPAPLKAAVELRDQPSQAAPGGMAATSEPEEVVVEREIGSVAFYLLSLLLICADFLANVPVFVELFPPNRQLDAAFARWEAQALAAGLTNGFGLRHLFTRVMAYPESSLLALSVIVFFLVLGHVLGGTLRVLVALWRHRTPHLSVEGTHRWRQALLPAALSLGGVVVVVGVLFAARASVRPLAQERVRAAEAVQHVAADAFAKAAADPSADLGALATARTRAQREVTLRQERLDYAAALSGMNLPITFLNVVLVTAAVVLGYQRHRERISVVPAAVAREAERDAELARRESDRAERESGRLQERLDTLRGEFLARRGEAHRAMREAEVAFNRVEHLLEAEVMRDWYGKAERLRRAIPLFRTENARLRGLDVEDVAAFRSAIVMNLPTPAQQSWVLDRPTTLEVYRSEFDQLRHRLHWLDLDAPGETATPTLSAA